MFDVAEIYIKTPESMFYRPGLFALRFFISFDAPSNFVFT